MLLCSTKTGELGGEQGSKGSTKGYIGRIGCVLLEDTEFCGIRENERILSGCFQARLHAELITRARRKPMNETQLRRNARLRATLLQARNRLKCRHEFLGKIPAPNEPALGLSFPGDGEVSEVAGGCAS
jgi:hypothetical protein